jgi:hypothetical protein
MANFSPSRGGTAETCFVQNATRSSVGSKLSAKSEGKGLRLVSAISIWGFENKVLKRIFWSREVTEGWRKLPTEGLHDLYSSAGITHSDQMKRDGTAVHVDPTAEMRNA